MNGGSQVEPSTLFGGISPEQIMAMSIMESCAAKTVLSGGAGFVLGGVFGTFMSSVDWNVNMDEYLKMSTKQQLRYIICLVTFLIQLLLQSCFIT